MSKRLVGTDLKSVRDERMNLLFHELLFEIEKYFLIFETYKNLALAETQAFFNVVTSVFYKDKHSLDFILDYLELYYDIDNDVKFTSKADSHVRIVESSDRDLLMLVDRFRRLPYDENLLVDEVAFNILSFKNELNLLIDAGLLDLNHLSSVDLMSKSYSGAAYDLASLKALSEDYDVSIQGLLVDHIKEYRDLLLLMNTVLILKLNKEANLNYNYNGYQIDLYMSLLTNKINLDIDISNFEIRKFNSFETLESEGISIIKLSDGDCKLAISSYDSIKRIFYNEEYQPLSLVEGSMVLYMVGDRYERIKDI